MRPIKFILLPLMAIILTACPWPGHGYRYNTGTLPDTPVNLEAFNTEYDDYNSTAPSLGRLVPFCYSTNRHSQGGEFNIKYEPMSVVFSKTTGDLTVLNEYIPYSSSNYEFEVLKNALYKANTTGNELGPNLLYEHYSELTGFVEYADIDFALLFASDAGGDFDISYTCNNDGSDFSEPREVGFLNSGSDDFYPSFNEDYSRIYFCSDRNGGFDIYYTKVDFVNDSIVPVLSDAEAHEILLDEVLSGDHDDKCPYIFSNTLVFASNRPGGYGGYDLYYSTLEEGEWGEPVNFGPAINSAHDDYRPILFEEDVDYDRIMMVFSSNRPGGKGGFDLYFVGVMN
jgi:hypothetical protein